MVTFLDLPAATADQLAAVDTLRKQLDASLGLPRRPTAWGSGKLPREPHDPDFGATLTCSAVMAHPTDPARFAFPVSDEMAAPLTKAVGDAKTAVQGGKPTPTDTAIAAMPAPAPLDATWAAASVAQPIDDGGIELIPADDGGGKP